MNLDELHRQLIAHQHEVIDRLGRIEVKLDNDFRALHGNGQPGLITKHAELEQRVASLEQTAKTQTGIAGKVAAIVAWGTTTAIACYNLFAKVNK